MRKPHARRRVRPDWARLEDRRVPAALVALIDSGVDLTSAADAPYYDFTSAYDSYDKVAITASNLSQVQDTSLQHGHGSTVADFIARGIADATAAAGAAAPVVRIMPIRDTAPGGLQPDDSALIRGVYWAADHGAAAINMSLRRYNGDFISDTDPSDPHYGTTLSQAIQYARSKGAMIVTSSGNESLNVDGPNLYGTYIMPGGAASPAHNGLGATLDNILTTSAVDGSNKLTQYSNWGPTTVNLGAPTGSGTDAVTSYSTGYSAGVAGVVAALTPGLTPAGRIAILDATVTPAAQAVGAWSISGGVINPAAAVARSLALFPPATTIAAADPALRIAAGPAAAAGGFAPDTGFVSGGNLATAAAGVSAPGIASPPPASIYATERWTYGTMTYTLPGLTPGAAYDVRLDFAETYYTAAGQRSFNVAINGSPALTGFDIIAAAGGPLRAITPSFPGVIADGAGRITIAFANIVGGAKVNAIEVSPTSTVALAAGSAAGSGPYGGDGAAAAGGSTYATVHAIDTAGVATPAPQAVYQSERWSYSSFTETIPGLVPGAAYQIRLDFSENYFNGPGQRTFDVSANGARVLANFDIYGAAGGMYRAVARTINATADASGRIALTFANTTPGNTPAGPRGGAKVDGIAASPLPGPTVLVAAGTSATLGGFAGDAANASGGSGYYAVGRAIDTSGVTNPAPQSVYQTERWDYAGFSETIPGLVPGATYQVRLDFSENYFNGAGQRTFNVAINGAGVLANFDIYGAAGGMYRAVARTFAATADASGRIVVGFANTTPGNSAASPRGGAKVDGIEVTPAAATQVDLSGLYNVIGITDDARPGLGNLDGAGASYSSSLIGPTAVVGGSTFALGPAGSADAVLARGQSVAVPAGAYRSLTLLGTAVNGGRSGSIVINYADGTTSGPIARWFSDWHAGPSGPGEVAAATMAFRNRAGGADRQGFDLYAYTIPIDPTRTVASITLPNDPNIAIFGIDLNP